MIVKYLPWQPHCFAFGGLEVQMLSTLKAVQDAGVNADKLDVWSRDGNFDILHIWGLDHVHEVAAYYGARAGKKILITSLFQDFDEPKRRLKHTVSKYLGAASIMIKLAAEASSIVVVNDIEADIATRYFNIPASKITYIPNIVDGKYFVTPPALKGNFRGVSNYVLCTGNICKRKNQLNLVKACISAKLNVVVIGKILTGEEEYGNEVIKLLNQTPGCLHVENLQENSDELISAYHNCAIFALPSLFEQGPISAYEALACGNRLLIADRRYAKQEFYRNVKKVDPMSVKDIAAGLTDMMQNPDSFTQPVSVMEPCKAVNVGNSYKALYEKIAGL